MTPTARFAATFVLAMVAAPLATSGEQSSKPVDFERHVMGLFSKMGCNSGSCHGSFQGKNGFRLSLFGYDADRDYAALTRDNLGRRINPVDPDHSLLLTKATGQMLHEGGARFARDSWQYQIFRDWIVAGAPRRPGSGEVAKLDINPAEFAFRKPGEKNQLRVQATFADGSREDVSAFCDFRVQDDTIAEVNAAGEVTARRPGDTAIVALYRGKVQAIRVLVPLEAAEGFKYPKVLAANYADQHVNAKLRRLNMVPSAVSSDLEFLRRVTIDTTGMLPTPDEVRAFLADSAEDKRERKIDELLKHPLHAAVWATKFSDITGNNTDTLEIPQPRRPKLSQMWHDWFAKRIRDNVPYDEVVKGVLTATSRDGLPAKEWIDQCNKYDEELKNGFCASYADKPTLDLFWRRQAAVPVEQWGEKVAAAFLGVRLECAQCHKHPTDRWTQQDYWSFANIFCAVQYPQNAFSTPDLKKMADAINTERKGGMQTKGNTNQIVLLRELYLGKVAPRPNPETKKPALPKALGGPDIPPSATIDMRGELFKWMRSPENPYFARSFVNRIWAHYFGTGIVEPVDDFSVANPPTNAPLLDALAKDFVKHNYDIRYIEKVVLTSLTYQRTSKPNETNRLDRRNFSHAQIRPMMAEVVVDVLNSALGTSETFTTDAPANSHLVEVGASRLANGNLNYVLKIFGRPPRTTACDCERAMDPALPQTLYRMTDPAILQKLQQKNNRVRKLLATKMSDEKVFEELMLATLTRKPTAEEKAAFAKHREAEPNRDAAFIDVLWALINTREFILNH